ncbi:hypothetical protein QYE76_063891 [Lolium multiflorum]|uniref:Protein kinase domain-containing protein n=1 Tax=Lolium multiflorum TaxID=4521 RepID=A0AAD8S5G5_LOLMU|nr:hypothetical protein QYE76_063891 [Lolium multiflorum]
MRSLLRSSLGILLLTLLLVLASSPPATPLSADGLALLAFKSAVTDDPSWALSAWSANDTDPCRWPGVACVNTSSSPEPRVAGLAVAGKNLTGYLPSELGSLAFLRRLNLHGNRLSGTVPPSLANATALRSIFLYDNNLTGAFPASLCDLPRLQNLDLSKNSLTGTLPPGLARCTQLERLIISSNDFTGAIPAAALPKMASLQLLDLSSNSLTGAIPPELGRLPALAGTLNISRNRLSGGVPPELGHLPATVSLDLRFNNLSGEIPQSGSLASQGPTAFLNNPGLCGFPLQVPCRAAPPSSSSPTAPIAIGPGATAGGPRQGIKTSLIVLISLADAAGVALIGVIVVYVYWKLRDRRGVHGDNDDDEEEGRGLFGCPCMRASSCGDSSDGSDAGGGGEKKKCGGEDGELVAIDRGFRMELDELLRSSAYVLGKGGKGIVYKVVVGNGTTPVAVRRIGGGTKAPERYKEFAAEAGAVGRVRHANVVRLRAYYWSPDEKLVVTDFINNGNLATALRGRSGQPSLSWSLRLRIAKGAARGLAHLHECSPRRYVHGEVKPSNVLLDSDYNALIADFGLARLLTIAGCADPAAAGAGGIMGGALPYVKPAPERPNAYRAPEARVPGARPSQKSDVYSFGVLLLELLTGRSPEHASPSGSSASFSGPGAADGQQQPQAPEIVRWVRQGFEDARPLSELADEAVLRDAGARKEVVAAFHVALGCVEADLERRPRMKAVSDKLEKIAS